MFGRCYLVFSICIRFEGLRRHWLSMFVEYAKFSGVALFGKGEGTFHTRDDSLVGANPACMDVGDGGGKHVFGGPLMLQNQGREEGIALLKLRQWRVV